MTLCKPITTNVANGHGHMWECFGGQLQDKARQDKTRQCSALCQPDKTRRVTPGFWKMLNTMQHSNLDSMWHSESKKVMSIWPAFTQYGSAWCYLFMVAPFICDIITKATFYHLCIITWRSCANTCIVWSVIPHPYNNFDNCLLEITMRVQKCTKLLMAWFTMSLEQHVLWYYCSWFIWQLL